MIMEAVWRRCIAKGGVFARRETLRVEMDASPCLPSVYVESLKYSVEFALGAFRRGSTFKFKAPVPLSETMLRVNNVAWRGNESRPRTIGRSLPRIDLDPPRRF